MEYIQLELKKGAIINRLNDTYNDHTSEECHFVKDIYDYGYRYLAAFDDFPENKKNKLINIEKTYIWIQVTKDYYTRGGVSKYPDKVGVAFNVNESDFDENTVTYDTKPSNNGFISTDILQSGTVGLLEAYLPFYGERYIRNLIDYGVLVSPQIISDDPETAPYSYERCSIETAVQEVSIFDLMVYLEDDDNGLEFYGASPTSGYLSKYEDHTFQWYTKVKGESYNQFNAESYVFKWRVVGSEEEHTVPCGTNTSYTVPANTFKDNDIEWCVAVTDNYGNVVQSDWYTISTEEALSTATADSPINKIVDTSNAVTFTWSHIIATGTAATKSELQMSVDNSTWEALATVEGSELTWTAPAQSISAGNKYWRVRTYNTDNAAGSWSDSKSFISLKAPVLKGVTADATPRATINWQCDDFNGYQIKIDDYDYGIKYGVSYSFKSPKFLQDGEHTAKVRVVNQYGLFSEWIEVVFTVANTYGDSIDIKVNITDNHIAELKWSTSGDYDAYIVYRDGVPIAKTTDSSYIDALSIGYHDYMIRGIYNDSDNYGISADVVTTLETEKAIISDVDIQEWIDINLSTESISRISFSIISQSNTRLYSSNKLPSAELSKQKTITVSGTTAFTSLDDALNFEALIGKIVCLKLKTGVEVIGLLTSQSKQINTFYISYTFSITQTEFNEEIEI